MLDFSKQGRQANLYRMGQRRAKSRCMLIVYNLTHVIGTVEQSVEQDLPLCFQAGGMQDMGCLTLQNQRVQLKQVDQFVVVGTRSGMQQRGSFP